MNGLNWKISVSTLGQRTVGNTFNVVIYPGRLCLHLSSSLISDFLSLQLVVPRAISQCMYFLISAHLFSQPYYSTRLNAADIESRVKQLDLTSEKEKAEGADKKLKGGFWEEFDVSQSQWKMTSLRCSSEYSQLFIYEINGIGGIKMK